METLKENNLYLRVLKFWESHPKWFSYAELTAVVKPKEWEDNIIKRYMHNAILNWKIGNNVLHESVFLESRITDIPNNDYVQNVATDTGMFSSELTRINSALNNAIFILKYDAYFNYIDYLELQKAIENSNEANTHAKWAKNLALWAIWIAIITWIIQSIIWIIQICLTK